MDAGFTLVFPRHCTMHTLRVTLMYYTPLEKSQLSRQPDVHESIFFLFLFDEGVILGYVPQNAGSDSMPPPINLSSSLLLFIVGPVTWAESLLG